MNGEVLRDMFPSFTTHYIKDSSTINVVSVCNIAIRRSCPVCGTNGQHLLSSEGGPSVLFTSCKSLWLRACVVALTSSLRFWVYLRNMTATACNATLCHCVLGVLFRRAKPEVVGANAGRIIASVAYKQFFRDRTVSNFPYNPMCRYKSTFELKQAVSVSTFAACPLPAFFGAVNFRPKTI
jgi:hypothetical protein